MLRTAGATLAAAGVLLLCGQALSDDRIRLPRKGSSPGIELRYDTDRHIPRQGSFAGPSREERQRWERRERRERREREERVEGRERQERQAARCWKLARSARVAQEEAKQKVVVGYLAGGLIGALITSSQNDDAYKEPKVLWDEVYNGCMGKRQGKDDRQDEETTMTERPRRAHPSQGVDPLRRARLGPGCLTKLRIVSLGFLRAAADETDSLPQPQLHSPPHHAEGMSST
jgi:hypothetical protein